MDARANRADREPVPTKAAAEDQVADYARALAKLNRQQRRAKLAKYQREFKQSQSSSKKQKR